MQLLTQLQDAADGTHAQTTLIFERPTHTTAFTEPPGSCRRLQQEYHQTVESTDLSQTPYLVWTVLVATAAVEMLSPMISPTTVSSSSVNWLELRVNKQTIDKILDTPLLQVLLARRFLPITLRL